MKLKTALFGMACAGGAAWMLLHRPPAEATEPIPLRPPRTTPHRTGSLAGTMPWFSQAPIEPLALAGAANAHLPVVTVHVIDDTGRPMAGVLVETAVDREQYQEQSNRPRPDSDPVDHEKETELLAVAAARSSREGTVLARVIPEVTTLFRVREENRFGVSEQVVVSPGDSTREVTLEVMESGGLIGRVQDEHGHAIPGATIATTLRSSDSAESIHAPGEIVTDSDGEYRVALLPGLFAVEISAPHRQKFVASAVQVLPGKDSKLEATLEAGVEIRGRILGPDDKPVPNATVDAISEKGDSSAVADAGGDFVIEGLAPGNYLLRPAAEGFLGEDLSDIEAGGEPLTIHLGAAGQIVGDLQIGAQLLASLIPPGENEGEDSGASAEVANARISIEGSSDSNSYFWSSSTGVDRTGHGTFSAGSLPAGTYQVVVAIGDTVTSSGEIKLAAGEEVHVELKAPEGSSGALAGLVRGPAGTPASSGEVTLQGMGASLSASIGPDGRYRFAGVPVGKLEVSAVVIADGRAYSTGVSTVLALPRQDLTLDLDSVVTAVPVVPDPALESGDPLVLTDPIPPSVGLPQSSPLGIGAGFQPAINVTWEGEALVVLQAPIGEGGARLRPGDQVTSVDGVTVGSAESPDGASPFVGAEGTPCRIAFTRPASGETLVVVLSRTEPVVQFEE